MMSIMRNDSGHYEMYIDDEFYGSYDTVGDAARDYDEYIENKEDTPDAV